MQTIPIGSAHLKNARKEQVKKARNHLLKAAKCSSSVLGVEVVEWVRISKKKKKIGVNSPQL